jgi:hypothetical protein
LKLSIKKEFFFENCFTPLIYLPTDNLIIENLPQEINLPADKLGLNMCERKFLRYNNYDSVNNLFCSQATLKTVVGDRLVISVCSPCSGVAFTPVSSSLEWPKS